MGNDIVYAVYDEKGKLRRVYLREDYAYGRCRKDRGYTYKICQLAGV